jgi:uncharacterized protein
VSTRSEELVARVREVLASRQDVRWAYLFGSAVNGEHHRDIDVGVVLVDEPAPSAVRFGQLAAQLAEALPEHPIDLVDLSAAALALRGEVVRGGIVVIDRDRSARLEWEIEVTRRWLDIAPWIARGAALRLEALRERRD